MILFITLSIEINYNLAFNEKIYMCMVKKEIKNIKYNIYIYILYCSQNMNYIFFLNYYDFIYYFIN